MAKTVTYKQQVATDGSTTDSWVIKYPGEDKIPELVFIDPNLPVTVDMSNVDLSTMTVAQIDALKVLLGL